MIRPFRFASDWRISLIVAAIPLLSACSVEDEAENSLISAAIVSLYDYKQGGVGVFLKTEDAHTVPIFIGHFEAQALQMAISKQKSARPLPYDLLENLLDEVDGTLRRVVVHSIEDNVFHAYLEIERKGENVRLDCRPSDGMVLATQADAPIFVTPEVVEKSGSGGQRVKKT